jgi:alkane 1-monooxygenase
MTLATSSPIDQKRLNAWPYWMTLTFVPLVVLAVVQGGWTILLIPVYGWVLMPILDIILGKDLHTGQRPAQP